MRAVEAAYDLHAAALYRIGLVVSGSSEAAREAVVAAFDALCRDEAAGATEDPRRMRAELAGEVCSRCSAVAPDLAGGADGATGGASALELLSRPQRELVALILFGGQSCRQAADSIGLDPATASRTVTDALRTVRDRPADDRLD